MMGQGGTWRASETLEEQPGSMLMRKVRAILPVLFAGIQMTHWLPRVSAKPPSLWHTAGKEVAGQVSGTLC